MSDAPKTASTLLPLPSERALFGEEPFGQPQETITHPTQTPSTRCRRDRTGRHGRGGLPGPAGAGRPVAGPHGRTAGGSSTARRGHGRGQLRRRLDRTSARHDPSGHGAPGRGSAQAVKYTVRSGDSLSAIAGRFYHKQTRGRSSTGPTATRSAGRTPSTSGRSCGSRPSPPRYPAHPGCSGRPHRPRPRRPRGQHGVRARAVHSRSASGYSGGTPGGSFGQCVDGPRVRR